MNRRDLLKAALALPLASRFARADAATAPRFLFIVEGNGFEPASVLCDSARAALDGALTGGAVARDRWWYNRAKHTAPMVVPAPDLGRSSYLQQQFGTAFPLEALETQGLVQDATVVLGLSARIVGGGHVGLHGALASARSNGGQPGGPTIDAWLAAQPSVRGVTPFEAFRVAVGSSTSINFGLSAFGRGRPAPVIRDLQAAYQFAYGAFLHGSSRVAFDRQNRMLAFAAGDVSASQAAFTGNALEAAKLDSYAQAIAELQLSQSRLQLMTVAAPTAPASGLSPLEAFDASLDLAVSTLLDGLTSVAVVGSGTGGDFGLTYSTISSTGRHDMQHQSGGTPAMLDAIRRVNHAQVTSIAKAARRLKDAGQLGRTVIVWVGDNGEQHHSTSSEFPVLLLGGQAVGLAPGGRTVIYPGVNARENRQLSNLWNTLGHVAGQDLNEFGGEAGGLRKAPGPLEELMG